MDAIPSFNIQPGETPSAVSQRRKLAELLMKQGMDTSPIAHPLQGAARVAQAMMGGWEMSRADQSERNAGKKLADYFVPEGGATTAATPPAAQPAPSGIGRVAAALNPATITSPQSAPVKDVYSADEQSPLDPVPGAITPDRARLLAAIQPGESGGRPNVMYGGKTFDSYADHPRQPQAITTGPNAGKTSTAAGLNQMIAPTWDRAKQALNLPDFSPGNQNAAGVYIAGDDYQKRTGQNLDVALAQAGNDPVKIAAIGKALSPTWTSLPGGIEPNQQTNQFVQNMQGGPHSDVTAQARPPQAPAQPTQAPAAGVRNAPQIPVELQGRLRALIMDPSTREYGLQLAAQYTKPSQSQWTQIGEDEDNNKIFGMVDTVSGKVTPYKLNAAGEMVPAGSLPSAGSGTRPAPSPAPASAPAGQRPAPGTVDVAAEPPTPAPPGMTGKAKKEWQNKQAELRSSAAAGHQTEAQAKGSQFAATMDVSERAIQPVEHVATQAGGAMWNAADRSLGPIGLGIPRNQMTPEQRQYHDAKNAWIEARLRQVSGATINPSEYKDTERAYFPMPGDGPADIERKRALRAEAQTQMARSAGLAYKAPQQQAATPRRPQVGAVEEGYRFKGGNPADPASWERAQ